MTEDSDNKPVETAADTEHRSWLALLGALVTTPKDALSEVCKRNLFVAGLTITVAVGLVQSACVLLNYYQDSSASLYQLGASNPMVSVGMMLITAAFTFGLASRFEGQGSFAETFAVLAWANAIVTVPTILSATVLPDIYVFVTWVWTFVVAIIGVQVAHRFPIWKSVAVYIGVWVGVAILSNEAAKSYVTSFYPKTGLDVPCMTVGMVAGAAVLSIAAALAIIIALIILPKMLNLPKLKGFLTGLCVLALASVVVQFVALQQFDPIREFARGVTAYDSEPAKPKQASDKFAKVLARVPSDVYVKLYLAHSLAASGEHKEAISLYEQLYDTKPDAVSALPVGLIARTGVGTALFFEGDYASALREIEQVTEKRSGSDAYSLQALIYLKTDRVKEAIESANKAVKSPGDAIVAHLVLVQSYTLLGKTEEAENAIEAAEKIDKPLAERVSSDPGGWSNAIDKLTPLDLRLPLVGWQFGK